MTHTPGPWERSSEPSDTGSSKELEQEPIVVSASSFYYRPKNTVFPLTHVEIY